MKLIFGWFESLSCIFLSCLIIRKTWKLLNYHVSGSEWVRPHESGSAITISLLFYTNLRISCTCISETRSKNDMLKKIRSDLRSRVMPFLIPKNLLDRGSQKGQGHFEWQSSFLFSLHFKFFNSLISICFHLPWPTGCMNVLFSCFYPFWAVFTSWCGDICFEIF